MAADLNTVQQDRGLAADRAEVQQDPAPGPGLRHGEAPFVQKRRPDRGRRLDAGEQALRAEGDKDLAGRASLNGEVPSAVEAEPLLPPQLRPGIALPGHLRQ